MVQNIRLIMIKIIVMKQQLKFFNWILLSCYIIEQQG